MISLIIVKPQKKHEQNVMLGPIARMAASH